MRQYSEYKSKAVERLLGEMPGPHGESGATEDWSSHGEWQLSSEEKDQGISPRQPRTLLSRFALPRIAPRYLLLSVAVNLVLILLLAAVFEWDFPFYAKRIIYILLSNG